MANLAPGQQPPGGGLVEGHGPADAGVPDSSDPTNEPGQYPSSLFGVALPQTSGAAGSPGAGGGSDPTNEPGQLDEGISGLGAADTADSGAPGSQGATNGGAGPDRVLYTSPGSFLSGTNETDEVHDSISGTSDWTQAIDGSYGGSLNLPGITGNQPTPNGGPYQPGSGRVRRGGFMNGQR